MKIKNRWPLLVAIGSLTTVTPCHADTPVTIGVVINTTSVIRNDINRKTFGSSVEAYDPQFGWVMGKPSNLDNPASDNARLKIKALGLGSMRFPGGDPTQDYIWWNPQKGARESNPNDPNAQTITQEEMLDYTAAPTASAPKGLDMSRLYQVNTSNYLRTNPWGPVYINANQPANASAAPVINWFAVQEASKSAAAWVANNNAKASQDPSKWVDHWEVGNEDWIWWTGAQYGQIFTAYMYRMFQERWNIKLLVQGVSQPVNIMANNTMENWVDGLKANIPNLPGSVYAYSDHQYLSGDVPLDPYQLDESRRKQTENMLAKVASGQRIQALKNKLESDPKTSPWKIWVTEFNATATGTNGDSAALNDMGHALVIADWTGKMLEQNIERMYMLSLDHHPIFALTQYERSHGASLAHPRVQPQAHAYSIYAQEFGETMVSNTASSAADNPFLTPDNRSLPAYKQLAIYSSIKKGPAGTTGQDTLRIIAINRSQKNSIRLNLKTDGGPGARWMQGTPATAAAKFSYRRLASTNIYDSNTSVPIDAPDKIHWEPELTSAAWSWPVYPTGITGAGLPPASVNLFVIPLQ